MLPGVPIALGAASSLSLGLLGVEQVSSDGPDLQGLALVITAISGLIATVGSLVIAFRRRPSSTADELALRLLAERAGLDPDHLDGDHP